MHSAFVFHITPHVPHCAVQPFLSQPLLHSIHEGTYLTSRARWISCTHASSPRSSSIDRDSKSGSMEDHGRNEVELVFSIYLKVHPLTISLKRYSSSSSDTIRLVPQQPPSFPHPMLHATNGQPSYPVAGPSRSNPIDTPYWYPNTPPEASNDDSNNAHTFDLRNIDPRLLDDGASATPIPAPAPAPVHYATAVPSPPPAIHFITPSAPASAAALAQYSTAGPSLPAAEHSNTLAPAAISPLPQTGQLASQSQAPSQTSPNAPATTTESALTKRKPGPWKKPHREPPVLTPYFPLVITAVTADTALHSLPTNVKQEPSSSSPLPSTNHAHLKSPLQIPVQEAPIPHPRRSTPKPKQNLRAYPDLNFERGARRRRRTKTNPANSPRDPGLQVSSADLDPPPGVERESDSEPEVYDSKKCPIKMPKHYREPELGSSWSEGGTAYVTEGKMMSLREKLEAAGFFD